MTLLEDIQNSALDSRSDLGTLLRKCKLLAARLGSKPLDDWLLWESNGYPDDVEVPDYRIWPLQVKGDFSGPFGSFARNMPIPSGCLPEQARDSYRNYKCRQSIVGIEDLVRRGKEDRVLVSTNDLAVVLGGNVYRGQNCIHAWAEFGLGHLIECLNTVRNRILDFALALWKEAPLAGDQTSKSQASIQPSRVTQIFNTTVYSGVASIVGSAPQSLINISVTENDFESLARTLRANAVEEQDLKYLGVALQSDGRIEKQKGYGPQVSSWIGGMMKKAADGTWKVGINVAANLLAQAIAKYYGI